MKLFIAYTDFSFGSTATSKGARLTIGLAETEDGIDDLVLGYLQDHKTKTRNEWAYHCVRISVYIIHSNEPILFKTEDLISEWYVYSGKPKKKVFKKG